MNKKRKRITVISSSDDEVHEEPSITMKNSKQIEVCSKLGESHVPNKEQPPNISSRKLVENSSDDENAKPELKATTTKHLKWKKNLEQLCRKKRAREGHLDREDRNSYSDKVIEGNGIHVSYGLTEEEEANLPTFKHEDFPPESDDSEPSRDDDFINDKDEETETSSRSDCSKDESDNGTSDDNVYINPYVERNNEMEREDLLEVLSKSTEKDRTNKKRYKKEIGNYQFSIHSESNRALQISDKERYNNHMAQARHDSSFKAERNIERGDEDFYYNTEVTILGDRVQVFPHSKRITRYSSRCEIYACGDKFVAGRTEIVGVKKFSEVALKFRKKPLGRNLGAESFYWICASHCPPSVWLGESSGSSSSGSSDNEVERD